MNWNETSRLFAPLCLHSRCPWAASRYPAESSFKKMTKIVGRSLIGFRENNGSGEPLYASDPTTGQRLQPGFIAATSQEVDLAVRLAAEAFAAYSRTTGRERGAF